MPSPDISRQVVSFPVTVEEPQLCPRFSARVIRNTRIIPSPANIAHRLQLLDQRPISNAVDATNYVLWESGKPTHVFDADLLEGGRIVVRKARAGETLKTLDGVERKLTPEDLVVADAKKPVGLAGVMGGYDTMITGKTCNIVIESAWWDPITIRKASRRHVLHTDASHRFERGADFESTVSSSNRVAELILQSGGGDLFGEVIDVVSQKMDQAPIVLRVSEVQRILGGNLDGGEIFRILKKLGFMVIPEGQAEARFRAIFDSQFQFNGWRAHDEQALQWPRERCQDPDKGLPITVLLLASGSYVDSNVVPKNVVDATCEMARELLIADRTAAASGAGRQRQRNHSARQLRRSREHVESRSQLAQGHHRNE